MLSSGGKWCSTGAAMQEQLVASPSVQQDVAVLQNRAQKIDVLLDFLAHLKSESEAAHGVESSRSRGSLRQSRQQHPRVLVFVNTKDQCEHLAWTLSDE